MIRASELATIKIHTSTQGQGLSAAVLVIDDMIAAHDDMFVDMIYHHVRIPPLFL